MSQLEIGSTYKLVVKEKHKMDSFQSSASGGTMYCHIFTMIDSENEKHKCQVCSSFPDEDPALAVGNAVKATIKKFTRSVYTLESICSISDQSSVVKTGPVRMPNTNPVIAGSIADRALSYAITYYGMPGIAIPFTDDQDNIDAVLNTADQFHAWLSNKIS